MYAFIILRGGKPRQIVTCDDLSHAAICHIDLSILTMNTLLIGNADEIVDVLVLVFDFYRNFRGTI